MTLAVYGDLGATKSQRQRTYARKGLVAVWDGGTARPLMFSIEHPADPLRFLSVILDEVQHRVRVVPDDEPGYLGVYLEEEADKLKAELLVRRLVTEGESR